MGGPVSSWESEDVKHTLSKSKVHDQWIAAFRTKENVRYFERALEHILGIVKPESDAIFMDAGCGTCVKSILLAQRGFRTVALDFSEAVLEMAASEIEAHGFQDKISLQREDITSLPFDDETFDHIVCWGVLMHIPDIETAMSELSRVVKKGGTIIFAENNMFSVYARLARGIKRILGKHSTTANRTQSGIEDWVETDEGMILVRQTDMQWFKGSWQQRGFTVESHVAGQFTELYTRFTTPSLRSVIHWFNDVWFRHVKMPSPAFGNIVIVQKNS